MSRRAPLIRALLCAGLLAGLAACDRADAPTEQVDKAPPPAQPEPSAEASGRDDPPAQDDTGALREDELTALAPDAADQPDPVPLADARRPLHLEVFSERGYENERGELILDVMERDYLYLSLLIEDDDGRPVQGARPVISPERDSRVVPMAGDADVSDAAGSYPFGLVGGSMGAERVRIAVGEAEESLTLNVISLRAAGYSSLSDIEGALDWDQLMQADIEWGETVSATFPEAVRAKDGQTVKLAGFMMPLEMKQEQDRFVMTSNPPSCFFHIPGGPAGAVEVLAKAPIEVVWDPIVLEGRFEVVDTGTTGALYRLHDARLVEQ